MNKTLKAVYYCATNQHRWGKGLTIAEAKKNAGLKTKAAEKRCQFYVTAAIFNDPSDADLQNLMNCIVSNQVHGNAEYYEVDRTPEDTTLINLMHVGWLMIEKNY